MTARKPSLITRIGTLESAPPWSTSTAVIMIVAAFVAVVAAVGFVQAWFGDRPATLLIAWTIAGLVVTIFVFQWRRAPADRIALRTTASGISLSLPLLLVINLAMAMLLDLITLAVTGLFLPAPELMSLTQVPLDTFTWIFAAVLMLLAQPLGEELIFRGVAQPSLRRALGPWPGLLVTALAYGVFHLAAYPPSLEMTQQTLIWYGLVLPALQGVVFGINRAVTGSTRAAIYAHIAFGIFALLKLFMLRQ